MNATIPMGFFAYPSQPPTLGETIKQAVQEINRTKQAQLRTWEQCSVGGKILIQEICREIDQSDFFCADLTGLNPNVMFELGYAIGRNKRIWLILDTSRANAKQDFEHFRTLTTIGYEPYCNSVDIRDRFYHGKPFTDLDSTVFRQAIEPSLVASKGNPIVYLKSRHETEASIRLTKRILTSTKNSHIPLITDDPRESPGESLAWYGTQVWSAQAVICHLGSPDSEGSRLHSARHALVAGIACGMRRGLLMLAEGAFLAPIDYRDLLRHYRTAAEATKHLEEWLQRIERPDRDRLACQNGLGSTLHLATELKGLQLGEHVAENESERLVQEYYVETASYREALEGKRAIFVGRKGSGKTANFLKLASSLESDPRNIVCIIQPVAYELQGMVKLLRRYSELDQKGYVIESLWKFLLYTEIANATVRRIESRVPSTRTMEEECLVEILKRDDGMLTDDFSVRLERCVSMLTTVCNDGEKAVGVGSSRAAISQALHSGILKELRVALGKVLNEKRRVTVLVDNLDKAWDKQSESRDLAQFILGLLNVAERVPVDFGHQDGYRDRVSVGLVVFLRSDIFYNVMNVAEEPDKIRFSKLSWSDQELLLRVVEERFVASHGGSALPSDMWDRYFCAEVRGVPTRDYLAKQVLPRPRDLVVFTKAAVTTAVNRGHARVEERDILEAEKQYSEHAMDSILVELVADGTSVDGLENVLYEFVGSTAYLTADEVRNCLTRAGTNDELIIPTIDHLCALSFLGIETREGEFRFTDDPREYRKNLVLARKLAETRGSGWRYMINRAFWACLEIDDGL